MTEEKRKRSGVILALVGVGLPLALFPFAHYYRADRGFLGSVSIMSIPLWQRKAEKPCPPATVRAVRCQELRMLLGDYAETDPDCLPCFPIPAEYFTVPYGYFFALGVVLFFGGLGLLLLGYMYEEKGGVS